MTPPGATVGEAREELALNLRRFAGMALNAGDLARTALLRRARSIRWPFLSEPTVLAVVRLAAAVEAVTTRPLAIKALRAAAEVLNHPIPSPADAYAEALIIAVYGPRIPKPVEDVLREATSST